MSPQQFAVARGTETVPLADPALPGRRLWPLALPMGFPCPHTHDRTFPRAPSTTLPLPPVATESAHMPNATRPPVPADHPQEQRVDPKVGAEAKADLPGREAGARAALAGGS